ncbi:hypothetical protein [Bdellovibrio sp. ZAP7]|uniref:hypothetical protein n=1 Tax=Bdellovibrio sp. ZAP7 TaxID=2231053 RepID=UPI001158C5DB|nr:hypothetical protein [Bdellovibrio sp. ZAP7]
MRSLILTLLILTTCFAMQANAYMSDDNHYQGLPEWSEFRQFIKEQQEEDERLGLSYMISGGIAAVGGVIGYDLSNDPLSRSVYALTSTVGIAAIGLGASHYWTGNEYDSFFYALENSNISVQEKNRILQKYLEKEHDKREARRWIRVVTHSLIAVANFYSASRETNGDVKPIFVFLGTVNTVLAISYSF